MPCFHPIPAWRTAGGEVRLNREMRDSEPLALPCGQCLGCRTSNARTWALRCHLELQDHRDASFITLTYDDKYLPPTLVKDHLSDFIRALRKKTKRVDPTRAIRFFASGEYGEQNERPHYHAILFGLDNPELVHDTWRKGHTHSGAVTPKSISYVAGYTSKKIGFRKEAATERVDPETGECYHWQPPFILMSRRPGIGANAKQHRSSWRMYAIHNGAQLPVPRFLHEAWKETATPEMHEQREFEKHILKRAKGGKQLTREALQAAEEIAVARQRIKAANRKL